MRGHDLRRAGPGPGGRQGDQQPLDRGPGREQAEVAEKGEHTFKLNHLYLITFIFQGG